MDKYKKISKVLWIILIANIIVASVKIFLGAILKLNSLIADGYHAISDSTSNVIGLIGIKYASKPADDKHPYGHHKYETIAGLIIGFMLFVITFQIIFNAIKWFVAPKQPTVTIPSLIALTITLIINIIVATLEYKKGKELNSEVLISDSIHTRSDIFISGGVLLTLILIKLGVSSIIDPILSLIIAAFVLRSCLEILKTTLSILLDEKTVDTDQIIEIVYGVDKDIIDIHKIRSRGRSDYVYIDLHIITHPDKTVKDAHELSHRIELKLEEILKKNVELIAHIEPNER